MPEVEGVVYNDKTLSNMELCMYKTGPARHWHRDVPRAGIQVPHIPYLLAYPSGSSPALGSRRKNSAGGVNLK